MGLLGMRSAAYRKIKHSAHSKFIRAFGDDEEIQILDHQLALEAMLSKAREIETRIEAAVVKGLTKFVGRKNSMAALKKPFDKVQSGSGQVVAIVGEAGVGKSRLLLEFKNLLPKGEYIYLEGRCIHYGGSMGYLPILDILRQ